MYQDILTTVAGRVATVKINRPEASNAFRKTCYGEIREAVSQFGSDPAVGAIVITGEGRHFSAGGDILRFKTLIESEEYLTAEGILYAGGMTDAIRRCPKPVIAMVNGVATGAGLSLCLACDFRVVSPSSKLIMAFVRMGLPGDTGSIYLLARLLGMEQACRMMMTGDPVSGSEAKEIGLASILAEEGRLTKETYDFAEKLATMSATAIARQKELLYAYFYQDLNHYFNAEAFSMAAASREPDFSEAVYAFIEKRPPAYNKATKSKEEPI